MEFFDDVTDIHKASPYVSNGHSWQHEHARRRRPLSALTGEEAGAQMNFQFSIFNFQSSKIFNLQFSILLNSRHPYSYAAWLFLQVLIHGLWVIGDLHTDSFGGRSVEKVQSIVVPDSEAHM